MSNGFVMITGASSGIGKAMPQQFAKKGYDLNSGGRDGKSDCRNSQRNGRKRDANALF